MSKYDKMKMCTLLEAFENLKAEIKELKEMNKEINSNCEKIKKLQDKVNGLSSRLSQTTRPVYYKG